MGYNLVMWVWLCQPSRVHSLQYCSRAAVCSIRKAILTFGSVTKAYPTLDIVKYTYEVSALGTRNGSISTNIHIHYQRACSNKGLKLPNDIKVFIYQNSYVLEL